SWAADVARRHCAAHAKMRALALRREAIPERGAHPFVEASAPASSAVDLREVVRRWPRIGTEARRRPLPHVSGHVQEPKRAGGVTTHFARAPRMLPAGASVGIFTPPRVRAILLAASRGELPLYFRGETRVSSLAV